MRLVLFMFAGREVNMRVQMPYLDRILDTHPDAELHLWDLTRDPADQRYLLGLEGAHEGRVHVLGYLHEGHPIMCLYPDGAPRRRGWPPCTCMKHKPPYEKPYLYYASQVEKDSTVYVKLDDDVLFLETSRFDDLINPLAEHPDQVISASVVNNAVCAKYRHDAMLTANQFSVGDPRDPKNDRRWWELHTNPTFARWCHNRFLAVHMPTTKGTYVRTRPGEAVSINCIAFTHRTMQRLAASFEHEPRLGDEGAVDRMLPWIALSFTAAHLSFGPQDKAMTTQELDSYRDQYAALAKGYLS